MPKRHRAYWKGYLRLSLVTIGVEVYNAIESASDILLLGSVRVFVCTASSY